MKKTICLLVLILLFLVSCAEKTIDMEKTDMEKRAEQYCGQENKYVYTCGSHIQVVSTLPGGGTWYYLADGTEHHCPIISLEAMTPECQRLVKENCSPKKVC